MKASSLLVPSSPSCVCVCQIRGINRVCSGCCWKLLASGHMCTTQHFIITTVTWRGHAGRGPLVSLTQPVGLLSPVLTMLLCCVSCVCVRTSGAPACCVVHRHTHTRTHTRQASSSQPAVLLWKSQVHYPCHVFLLLKHRGDVMKSTHTHSILGNGSVYHRANHRIHSPVWCGAALWRCDAFSDQTLCVFHIQLLDLIAECLIFEATEVQWWWHSYGVLGLNWAVMMLWY